MPTIIVHVQNEEPVLGEIDQMITPQDSLLILKNPRRKDGKDIAFLDGNVSTVIWPYNRITFIEIIPGADEEEEIISFVRE